MTRIFDETGRSRVRHRHRGGPCHVTQIKTDAKDGYNAMQMGFEHAKQLNKPERGHLGTLPPVRHLREFRTDDVDRVPSGPGCSTWRSVRRRAIWSMSRATSKGRGFAGGMKRHGFEGGPATHGQSDRQRSVGSIGSGTTPGRVFKGMRGPGTWAIAASP